MHSENPTPTPLPLSRGGVGGGVPKLWGVINLTPDSFYALSRATVSEAVRRAAKMFEDGAAVIDVGAESTRPGALAVASEDQIAVLKPFLTEYQSAFGLKALKDVSVDTRDAAVMRSVTDLGVGYINDVSGGSDEIFRFMAGTEAGYVLMHTKGNPDTMQQSPQYDDVVAEVLAFLQDRTAMLTAAGVASSRIIWDTGIGFGKTPDHNLRLIAQQNKFYQQGFRVLAGVSRKSFLGKILGQSDPDERLIGTLAAQAYLTLRGCDILRVHDVREMADTLKIISAIQKHVDE